MKRKLVKMGKSCLMTAIPKKWLDQNNLKKGDKIEFNLNDNNLIISSKPKIIEKEISIKLKESNRTATYRILSSLYDSGFTKVKIEYDKEESLRHILWAINILQEWKLEPTSKNKCIIKTFRGESEDIKVLFRRTLLLIKEYINEITNFINRNDDNLENIRAQYSIILSQIQTIKRLINTSLLPLEYKHYYVIAIQLEEIADHYEYLLRNLEKNKKHDSELFLLQKKLSKLYEQIYSLLYSFDIDSFVKFHNEINIWKWFENKTNSEEIYHLRAVSERMRNILKYGVGVNIKE